MGEGGTPGLIHAIRRGVERAGIAVIRTFLPWSLEVEIDGRWP